MLLHQRVSRQLRKNQREALLSPTFTLRRRGTPQSVFTAGKLLHASGQSVSLRITVKRADAFAKVHVRAGHRTIGDARVFRQTLGCEGVRNRSVSVKLEASVLSRLRTATV